MWEQPREALQYSCHRLPIPLAGPDKQAKIKEPWQTIWIGLLVVAQHEQIFVSAFAHIWRWLKDSGKKFGHNFGGSCNNTAVSSMTKHKPEILEPGKDGFAHDQWATDTSILSEDNTNQLDTQGIIARCINDLNPRMRDKTQPCAPNVIHAHPTGKLSKSQRKPWNRLAKVEEQRCLCVL